MCKKPGKGTFLLAPKLNFTTGFRRCGDDVIVDSLQQVPWVESRSLPLFSSTTAYLEHLYKGRQAEIVLNGKRLRRRSLVALMQSPTTYAICDEPHLRAATFRDAKLSVTIGAARQTEGEVQAEPVRGFFIYGGKRLLTPYLQLASQCGSSAVALIGMVEVDGIRCSDTGLALCLPPADSETLGKEIEAKAMLYLRSNGSSSSLVWQTEFDAKGSRGFAQTRGLQASQETEECQKEGQTVQSTSPNPATRSEFSVSSAMDAMDATATQGADSANEGQTPGGSPVKKLKRATAAGGQSPTDGSKTGRNKQMRGAHWTAKDLERRQADMKHFVSEFQIPLMDRQVDAIVSYLASRMDKSGNIPSASNAFAGSQDPPIVEHDKPENSPGFHPHVSEGSCLMMEETDNTVSTKETETEGGNVSDEKSENISEEAAAYSTTEDTAEPMEQEPPKENPLLAAERERRQAAESRVLEEFKLEIQDRERLGELIRLERETINGWRQEIARVQSVEKEMKYLLSKLCMLYEQKQGKASM
mmetsp:Transcript_48156/g.75219  ORF Transcript_48156/g.75219 Transcript_48156/m.75219 type:complete len:530 (-) Transcript_48156:870-2459(-)